MSTTRLRITVFGTPNDIERSIAGVQDALRGFEWKTPDPIAGDPPNEGEEAAELTVSEPERIQVKPGILFQVEELPPEPSRPAIALLTFASDSDAAEARARLNAVGNIQLDEG